MGESFHWHRWIEKPYNLSEDLRLTEGTEAEAFIEASPVARRDDKELSNCAVCDCLVARPGLREEDVLDQMLQLGEVLESHRGEVSLTIDLMKQ